MRKFAAALPLITNLGTQSFLDFDAIHKHFKAIVRIACKELFAWKSDIIHVELRENWISIDCNGRQSTNGH